MRGLGVWVEWEKGGGEQGKGRKGSGESRSGKARRNKKRSGEGKSKGGVGWGGGQGTEGNGRYFSFFFFLWDGVRKGGQGCGLGDALGKKERTTKPCFLLLSVYCVLSHSLTHTHTHTHTLTHPHTKRTHRVVWLQLVRVVNGQTNK